MVRTASAFSNIGYSGDKNDPTVVSTAECVAANAIDIDTRSEITNISNVTRNSQAPLTTTDRIHVEKNIYDASIITLPNCPHVNNLDSVSRVSSDQVANCAVPQKRKSDF